LGVPQPPGFRVPARARVHAAAHAPRIRIVLMLATFGIGCSIVTGRRRLQTAIVVAIAAAVVQTVLPFFVEDRYRAPLLVPLIVAAGAGISQLLRIAREPSLRSVRPAAAIALATLLMGLIAWLPLERPLMGPDLMLAQAYQARGELPAASAAYESA